MTYFGFLNCTLSAKSDLATTDNKKEYERGKKKYQQLLKKQETLLRGKDVNIYKLPNVQCTCSVEPSCMQAFFVIGFEKRRLPAYTYSRNC